MSEVITVRPMRPCDEAFVVDSWADCFWRSRFSGVLPRAVYSAVHRRHFTSVINERERVTTLVAVNPQEDNPRFEIYGVLVCEVRPHTQIIHWAYVKHGLRQHGVGRFLLHEAGIDLSGEKELVATCMTKTARHICSTKKLAIRHDPGYLRDEGWKKNATKTSVIPRNSRAPETLEKAAEPVEMEVFVRRRGRVVVVGQGGADGSHRVGER